jgi:hypothetical protein
MEDGTYEDGKREDAKGHGLDVAIDRAVREMLDVEPPADLRARVIAELPASGFRLPASGFRLPAFSFQGFAAVAAAAALLVLVLVVARRSEPPAPPVIAGAGVQPPFERAPRPATETPATPATAALSVAARAAVVTAAIAEEASPAGDIEPLKQITPIEVASIGQSNIAPDPIAVRPLIPITEVQIAPLNPPDRRD